MARATPLTRRSLIAVACAAAWAAPAATAPLAYDLRPVKIGEHTWAVLGAPEAIAAANGGAIANAAFVGTGGGAIVIDCGPSLRYGRALRALCERITGEPVVRVYLTHLHPDHVLGAGAFDAKTVAATPAAISDIAAEGPGYADQMYRLLGDWMRGTQASPPGHVLTADAERFGDHAFRLLPLAGHSSADLAILDETSGILFAGDLVFLDRAPATPSADIARWLAALETLAGLPHRALLPGHGPFDPEGRGIAQTRQWLAWLDTALRGGVGRGLDMVEAGSVAIPPAFATMAMTRYELARSVSHFYPRLESELLPRLDRMA